MKLSKITQSRPATSTINVLGEIVTVTYDRAAINGKEQRGSVRASLTRVLIAWDVTDDDGKPYQPPDNANGSRPAEWLKLLEPIPDDVLNAVWIGILDDMYAGNAVRSGSGAT